MSALSRLLSEANTEGLAAREIARRAADLNEKVNHDTAARYLRGDHGRPDESTLKAFSKVLGVPMQRLRQAAGLPDESTEPYVPPPESSRLTRRQRLAVDEIIKAMLDPVGRHKGAAPAAGSDAPVRLRPAARRGSAEPPQR